ncbi:hypothetical protein EDC04DRAFT_2602877 [Pisolithus marmoratus]|nr:hypothetical protein EDC04DRAFT_2602877 [Pisolithus marmoratus]
MSDFPLLKKWQLLASALREGWLGTGPVEKCVRTQDLARLLVMQFKQDHVANVEICWKKKTFNALIQSTVASGPEQDVAIVTCMGYYKSMDTSADRPNTFPQSPTVISCLTIIASGGPGVRVLAND